MKSTLIISAFCATFVSAAVFTVGVGKDETNGKKGLGFDPSVIHPQPGDTIIFEYRSGEHSAVQSTFETPCTPASGGYDSGVQKVDDSLAVDAPGLPTTEFKVADTNPIWFFDQAGGRCKEGGVFAVNPTAQQTPALFKENAAKDASGSNPAPASGGSATSPSSGSPTGTATSPSSTAPSSSPSNAASTSVNGFSPLLGLGFAGIMALM